MIRSEAKPTQPQRHSGLRLLRRLARAEVLGPESLAWTSAGVKLIERRCYARADQRARHPERFDRYNIVNETDLRDGAEWLAAHLS